MLTMAKLFQEKQAKPQHRRAIRVSQSRTTSFNHENSTLALFSAAASLSLLLLVLSIGFQIEDASCAMHTD